MSKKESQGLNTTHKILIAGIVVILCAVVGVGVYLVKSRQPAPAAPAPAVVGGVGVIDESNLADIERELAETGGGFNVKMNTDWIFPTADAASTNAYVANTEYNKKSFFFELKLADTDELIYTSTVIPVGSAIKEVKLDKTDLPAGTYDVVCVYNLLNKDNVADDYVNMAITVTIEQ